MAIPTRTSSPSLDPARRQQLLTGFSPWLSTGPAEDPDSWQQLWRRHWAELLSWWTQDPADHEGPGSPGGPGTRPWGWWEYDAPEPRRILDRHEATRTCAEAGIVPQSGFQFAFGIPTTYVKWSPTRPPIIEAEAVYLDRHDLLTDRERKLYDAGELETRPLVHQWGPGCSLPERVPEGVKLTDWLQERR